MATRLDATIVKLAFVFILIGYGTKAAVSLGLSERCPRTGQSGRVRILESVLETRLCWKATRKVWEQLSEMQNLQLLIERALGDS